jgi:hypothetical protein
VLVPAQGHFVVEHRILTHEGEERDVLIQGPARLYARGAVVNIVGILQDITERKRAEAALKAPSSASRSPFATARSFSMAVPPFGERSGAGLEREMAIGNTGAGRTPGALVPLSVHNV